MMALSMDRLGLSGWDLSGWIWTVESSAGVAAWAVGSVGVAGVRVECPARFVFQRQLELLGGGHRNRVAGE